MSKLTHSKESSASFASWKERREAFFSLKIIGKSRATRSGPSRFVCMEGEDTGIAGRLSRASAVRPLQKPASAPQTREFVLPLQFFRSRYLSRNPRKKNLAARVERSPPVSRVRTTTLWSAAACCRYSSGSLLPNPGRPRAAVHTACAVSKLTTKERKQTYALQRVQRFICFMGETPRGILLAQDHRKKSCHAIRPEPVRVHGGEHHRYSLEAFAHERSSPRGVFG